jgi:hypothetical protein
MESVVAFRQHSTVNYILITTETAENTRDVEEAIVVAYPTIIAPFREWQLHEAEKHVLSAPETPTGILLFFCKQSIVCILSTKVLKSLQPHSLFVFVDCVFLSPLFQLPFKDSAHISSAFIYTRCVQYNLYLRCFKIPFPYA